MRSWILLSSLLATSAFAGEKMDVQGLQDQINFFAHINQDAATSECSSIDPSLHLLSSCATLSDDFCSNLWSPKNKGSMATFDGAIKQGKSEGGLSYVARADYEALIAGLPNMPADLQKALSGPVADLKDALAHESKDPGWSDHLGGISQGIHDAIEDVAQARVKAAFPKGDLDSASPEERYQRRQVGNTASDDVLKGKYQNSENWKRVERIFNQARSDVATAIGKLPLSPDVKKAMVEKVSTVALTLPVKGIQAEDDCTTTQVNGFYMPNYHKFTICAGMFNSMQSESALYGVIAHEISHSVDPSTFASDRWTRESAVAKAVAKIDGGPGMSCEDWEDTVKVIDASVKLPLNRTIPQLDSFYNCLQPRSDLDKFTAANLNSAAQQSTRQAMASMASSGYFRALGDSSYKQMAGKNPYFLDARQLFLGKYRVDKKQGNGSSLDPSEVFAQDLKCQTAKVNGKDVAYADLPADKQAPLFHDALFETQRLMKEGTVDQYRYCGEACRELSDSNLSINPQENWADWMSYHAQGVRLPRLPAEHRKEAALLSGAELCDKHGSDSDAGSAFAELERKFSGETHPDDRVRRHSAFNQEVSAAAGCEMDTNSKKGFAACELK